MSDPSLSRLPDRECVEGYVFAGRPRRYLLLKRSAAKGGFWQSVSGRCEARDRSFLDAVEREVREETGFQPLQTIDLDWSINFTLPGERLWRLHAFAVEVTAPQPPRLSVEHTDFRWLPYDRACSLMFWEDNREALRRLIMRLGP